MRGHQAGTTGLLFGQCPFYLFQALRGFWWCRGWISHGFPHLSAGIVQFFLNPGAQVPLKRIEGLQALESTQLCVECLLRALLALSASFVFPLRTTINTRKGPRCEGPMYFVCGSTMKDASEDETWGLKKRGLGRKR